MGKVSLIEELVVENERDWLTVDEQIELTIQDIFKNANEIIETEDSQYDKQTNNFPQNLSISPLDYYQWWNGILIKKEVKSNYVKNFRKEIYNNLVIIYWKELIDTLFYILNSSNHIKQLYGFTFKISNPRAVTAIYLLSVIELEIIWKTELSYTIINELEKEWIDDNWKQALWLILFEKWNYEHSYKLLSEIINKKENENNIELLEIFILLNKFLNKGNGNGKTLNQYKKVLSEEEKTNGWLWFYYLNLLSYHMSANLNPEELVTLSNEYKSKRLEKIVDIELYLTYGYLLQGKLEKASEISNENNFFSTDIDFLQDTWKIESFYLLWATLKLPWAIEILINFYKKEFWEKWHNDNYFNTLLYLISNWYYIPTEEDKILFIIYDNEISLLKKDDDDIDSLIETLFEVYDITSFSYYLNEIFLIISKVLKWKYKDMDKYNAKKAIIRWIEGSIIISTSDEILTEELFEEKLEKKEKLLGNNEIVDSTFSEVVLEITNTILYNIKEIEKLYDIPTYLASIFEHYNLYDDKNKAFSYDSFSKERTN